MRFVSLIPAIVALFLSSAASAQVWEEYVNRENFFQVNMPGEPTMTEVPYRTVKGTNLTARVFTAKADPNSITAGTYRVTVVDYSSAQGELGDAIEQARQAILAKGMVKYDDINNLDFHRSRRITVENANSRILGGDPDLRDQSPVHRGRRNAAQRPAGSAIPGVAANPQQRGRAHPRADGNRSTGERGQTGWRTCERRRSVACYRGDLRLVAQSRGRQLRGGLFQVGRTREDAAQEDAIAGTVTNAGMTIPGQLIIVGPREGQFIDPMSDRAIFLFENTADNKLNFVAVGAPALGWPEVNLERCSG